MPPRFLSDAELAQLAGFPADIAAEDLVTYFTLEPDDARWAMTDHRGQANRLGLALQLCSLRWLGFVPDDLTSAPPAAVARLARQLDVGPGVLASAPLESGSSRNTALPEQPTGQSATTASVLVESRALRGA